MRGSIPDCRLARTWRPRWSRAATSAAPRTHSANTWAEAQRRTSPPNGPRWRRWSRWIRDAGGIASLAHPARYTLSAGGRRQLLADFVAAGGAALEVVTGGNGAQHCDANAALAMKFGLLGSIGSDFHDPQLAWNPLGRLAKLPDCVVPVWRSHL